MSMDYDIHCPTGEQCDTNAAILVAPGIIGYAIWYPQMGGYCGCALAVPDGDCIDVYVWHEGDFPFADRVQPPRLIHHCDPHQFVSFGQTLIKLFNPDRQ